MPDIFAAPSPIEDAPLDQEIIVAGPELLPCMATCGPDGVWHAATYANGSWELTGKSAPTVWWPKPKWRIPGSPSDPSMN